MASQNIHQVLEQFWGHKNFRPQQEAIINSVLEGKDAMAILPTGGGKSVCFQVPAMVLDGLCIVISPLIALMQDQVEALNSKNIPALLIHTGMPYSMVKKTLEAACSGQFKFLYLSPERLETKLFQEYLPALPISFFAIDEAHCISQWGYDFRPPYLRISDTTKQKPNCPIIALTASATAIVQNDIIEKLQLNAPEVYRQSFSRPNIYYYSLQPENKITQLLNLCAKLNTDVEASGIVYCYSRKQTKEYCLLLTQQGISADYYHAGLSNEERKEKLNSWLQNKTKIIVCTNAFGMGIDKPNVRLVAHIHIPDCLENYYQEAGRAGRDGNKSYATLLYNESDKEVLYQRLEQQYPTPETIMDIYGSIFNFLNISILEGAGQHYSFDIKLFCDNFNLSPITVNAVLKILYAENILSYNENAFTPSNCTYLADKNLLQEFINKMPSYEPLLTGMLRLYGGLFEMVKIINERKLAKFLNLPLQYIENQLQELNQLKIIAYENANNDELIYLLANRMPIKELAINFERINKRKALQKSKIDDMLNYISSTNCRSTFISNYFGDSATKTCGVCDNCTKLTISKIKTGELKLLLQLLKNIKEKCITPTLQQPLINKVGSDNYFKALNILQDEMLIKIDQTGNITIN